MPETHRDGIVELPSLRRRFDRPVKALEQPDAEVVLQELDLPADGSLRNAQFLGGAGEASEAGDSLENDQAVGRREPVAEPILSHFHQF